jgi:hypothetical protein
MKRFVLLLGSVSMLALAVACSSKDDSGNKTGDEQDICETKPTAKGCPSAPGTKLGGKKDGGSSDPGTPMPTPAPDPTPDAGTTSDGSTPQSVNPRDVCVDTANAVATAAQRCGELFADAFQDFVNAAAGGDCKNVKNIRDVNALYQSCIPWIQKATCNDLKAGNLPDSCLGQLLP